MLTFEETTTESHSRTLTRAFSFYSLSLSIALMQDFCKTKQNTREREEEESARLSAELSNLAKRCFSECDQTDPVEWWLKAVLEASKYTISNYTFTQTHDNG